MEQSRGGHPFDLDQRYDALVDLFVFHGSRLVLLPFDFVVGVQSALDLTGDSFLKGFELDGHDLSRLVEIVLVSV